MGIYPPWVCRTLTLATLAARWLHESQPISNQLESWGFHTVRGGIDPLSSPGCWSLRDMEGLLIRGRGPFLLGRCGTSALARGATTDPRWLHEPQPISNQQVGLGVSHRPGWYRPGGSQFPSPGCWSCKDMEGFIIRRYDPILPRVRGDLDVGPRVHSRRALAP